MSFTPEPGWGSRAEESGDSQSQPTPAAPIAADDDAPMWLVAELPAQAPTTRYVPSEDAYSGPDAEAPLWLTASMEKGEAPIEPTPPVAAQFGAAPHVGAAPQFGVPQQQPTPAAAPAYGSPAYGSPAYPAPAAYPPPALGNPAYPAPAPASYAPMAYPAPAYGNPGYPAPSFGAPKRKRKAWPWVVGGIATLLVVGGIGTVALTAIMDGLNADQNDNYTGEVISPDDAPTLGDEVIVSQSGRVAFDIKDEWIPTSDVVDVSDVLESLPPGATLEASYLTTDPRTATSAIPTLVMVLEMSPSVALTTVDIDGAHKAYIEAGVAAIERTGTVVTSAGPQPVTTVNGLDGLVTTLSFNQDGIEVRANEYTFARAQRVVIIQVMSYDGAFDDVTSRLLLDTLRVDK